MLFRSVRKLIEALKGMSKKPHRKHRSNQSSAPQGASRPVRAGAAAGAGGTGPALKADAGTRQQHRSIASLGGRVVRDVTGFGFGRSMAIGRLVVLEAMRMRVWGVILIGLLAIVVSDLTTRHFNPITDILPSLVRTSEITLTVLGIVVEIGRASCRERV